MDKSTVENTVRNIFTENRKCIVNTDLDGLLSGMLLQAILHWEVVGFSSCQGKETDEVWLLGDRTDFTDCVFVDLPVALPAVSVIDQHFVSVNTDSVNAYIAMGNKINPNVMRGRVLKKAEGGSDYSGKYPFGTVHFVLAILERLNLIPEDFTFDFQKDLGDFDLADLFFRADRVIGNTNQYNPNCTDWAGWLMDLGGRYTQKLFETAIREYENRLVSEQRVENKVLRLGCGGKDGDCANLFRNGDNAQIEKYFAYLGSAVGLPPIPIGAYRPFAGIHGKRMDITRENEERWIQELGEEDVFSYAFVSKRILSIAHMRGE